MIRAYDALEVFRRARASGGFRSGRLLAPAEPGQPLLVIAEWDDAGSYDRWLANPAREELGLEIEPLLVEKPAAGQIYHDASGGQAETDSG